MGRWFLSRKFSEVTQPQSLRTQSIGNQQWGDLSETCVGIRRLASGGGGECDPAALELLLLRKGPCSCTPAALHPHVHHKPQLFAQSMPAQDVA